MVNSEVDIEASNTSNVPDYGESIENSQRDGSKINQEQIHGLLFGEHLSWQAIIYDLINTEQLDPWDMNLVLLSNKYLEKVSELEEADFFVSSKVLLAAALLLRIKSEILLHRYIPSLDDILFGKKEEKRYVQERIELDEEIPDLVPRTPLPRFRKVTLEELMSALGKAITTENRRIKKVLTTREQELETSLSLPKKHINLKDQIRNVHSKLKERLSNDDPKVAFSDISGDSKEDMLATFIPLLYLDVQHKIFLEQEQPFEVIWIWLKKHYDMYHAEILEQMRKDVEDSLKAEAIKEKLEIEGEEGYSYEEDEPEEEIKKNDFSRTTTDYDEED